LARTESLNCQANHCKNVILTGLVVGKGILVQVVDFYLINTACKAVAVGWAAAMGRDQIPVPLNGIDTPQLNKKGLVRRRRLPAFGFAVLRTTSTSFRA
jgi:hypothetical protein